LDAGWLTSSLRSLSAFTAQQIAIATLWSFFFGLFNEFYAAFEKHLFRKLFERNKGRY
jgi:hypothetical protein